MHSVFAYLWETISIFDFVTFTSVTSWNAYDPFTGEFMYKMTDVPSDSRVYGPQGEIYIYTVNLAQGWMTLWYSSRTVQPQNTGTPDDGSWGSVANTGRTFDATRGIEWNKTIPQGLQGSVNAVFFEDRVVGSTATGWRGIGTEPIAIIIAIALVGLLLVLLLRKR